MSVRARDDGFFEEICGFTLRFKKVGDRSNDETKIIFLHEGLGSIALWSVFPDMLCKRLGVGGLLYERRGYGRSQRHSWIGNVEYLREEALDVLPEIIRRFEIEKPVLLGHSDGATIALIFAGGRPDELSAVISIASHSFLEEITVKGLESSREDYENGDLKQKLEKFHGDKIDDIFYSWNTTWLDERFSDWNIFEYLDNISAPAFAIQGDGDIFGSERQLDVVVERTKGPAEKLLIENCGHAPHRERPKTLLNAIEKFITKQKIL